MPGDTIIMDSNEEAETDEKCEEQAISHISSHIINNKLVIPNGFVWIEGDNTQNSQDSRNFGPVSQGLIRSKVVARIWPFSSMTFL